MPVASVLPAALSRIAWSFGVLATGVLTACGPATLPPGDSITDMDEAQNRAAHEFNLSLDRGLVGPAANAYGTAVPGPVRQGVSNFASNLNQPGYVLNDLLQLRIEDAITNTFRFAINSTIGIGGLLDPSSGIGLTARETDFGETLYLYGVPEGDFVMLPVFGPSTTRDTVGMVVDIATNPVRHILTTPESRYATGTGLADRLNSRHESDDTIDSVLYDSADSYAALRSLYLQNRRFALRGTDLSYDDPYMTEGVDPAAADPSLDPFYDPYSDPYFDPYAN